MAWKLAEIFCILNVGESDFLQRLSEEWELPLKDMLALLGRL